MENDKSEKEVEEVKHKNIYLATRKRKTKTTYYYKITIQHQKTKTIKWLNRDEYTLEDAIRIRDEIIKEREDKIEKERLDTFFKKWGIIN